MKVVVRAAKGIAAKFRKKTAERKDDLSAIHLLLKGVESSPNVAEEAHQLKIQEKNIAYLMQALVFFREEFDIPEQQYTDLCWRLATQMDKPLIRLKGCILDLSEEHSIVLKQMRDLGPRLTYEVDFNGCVYHATVEKMLQPRRGLDKIVPHFV